MEVKGLRGAEVIMNRDVEILELRQRLAEYEKAVRWLWTVRRLILQGTVRF